MAYEFGPLSIDELGVKQLFTNRLGGFSKGAYLSFNMGLATSDNSDDLASNYNKLKDELCLGDYYFVRTKQTHSNNIQIVDKTFLAAANGKEISVDNCDGLITDEIGVVLATYYADCTPVFFLDKKKKVVGVNHSGWRGTRNEISKDMIDIFINVYGSDPKDIMVFIGPNISKCCYEVSEDLYHEFKDFHEYKVIEASKTKKGKYYLDMKKAIQVTVLKTGVLEDNIFISEECTSCLDQKFYSYRRDNKLTGRLSGMMWLEK
jgi:YfiH family protein